MLKAKFFTLIIGTEILNRRREDAHFGFVSSVLLSRGHKLTGSFVIEDDPELIVKTIEFIASQENSILFSFGGIGSTPDDHTRKCAAIALSNGILYMHKEAKKIIEQKLADKAYPHAIKMAELPKGAKLLENPLNKMPAFSLNERFFFMPGFPQMSHPMVESILQKLITEKKELYRYTLTAHCKESEFIELMESMPKELECSSLPKIHSDGWGVSISVASEDKTLAKDSFKKFIDMLEDKKIVYALVDEV
jgi:molybdopterin-biosynthesis enzyme MoeA-like protein